MTGNDPAAGPTGTAAEARLATVEEHGDRENHHDLEGIMGTFGANAWYDDEPLDRGLGRVLLGLAHPLTVGRAVLRTLLGKNS